MLQPKLSQNLALFIGFPINSQKGALLPESQTKISSLLSAAYAGVEMLDRDSDQLKKSAQRGSGDPIICF